ncbi:MAG: molybdopterin-dependent oxidoreductase [Helicobacteraceae bacterium]|jgi:anaerobic selenocysteine-containing dehydrogenase|nr:molybdopterin-dependent oxidoreductase [Helicobacteraceae bacterium]
MSQTTACPLDCYDACSIDVVDGRLKGSQDTYTQGCLCPHLNHYENYERIAVPRYEGKEITMDAALHLLKERCARVSDPSQILHYRGHGNFGLMQQATDHFFATYGATLTEGSLCDGAGEAGVLEGRGSNKLLPPEQIAKSEVVIVWGRNIHTTNSHLLPFLKGKTIIVIDPVKTKLAEKADFYLQIKPKGDLYLALLLSRFAILNGLTDEQFLNEYATEYEDFYELTQTVRIKAVLDRIDVTLGDIGKILDLIKGKRTVILAGVGIQKYRHGADVMHAIDSFGALLGLFGKEGCGVNFMGNSKEGVLSPFTTKNKSKPVTVGNVDFGRFEMAFVQGSNPLNQMPDTNRVRASIEKNPFVVYFGLYENETSAVADLIIPAKNFLEKDDIRSSYGHPGLLDMPKVVEGTVGISEYDLAAELCKAFDIDMDSALTYLDYFQAFGESRETDTIVKGREEIPYRNGFDTDDKEFCFLEEYESDTDQDGDLFLLTVKSAKSLNSQFKRDSRVYLNASHGFGEEEMVRISSDKGSIELAAAIDERLRDDCVLIYSGTAGVNVLTDSKLSYEGKNAAYQENKIKVEKC